MDAIIKIKEVKHNQKYKNDLIKQCICCRKESDICIEIGNDNYGMQQIVVLPLCKEHLDELEYKINLSKK